MATDMSPSIAQPRRPRRSSAPITAAILSTRTFWGCSNGGRQALMEAQRDPQDFDGLISGAPAYDFTNIAGGFIKNIKAVFTARDSARTPVVTRDNLALIERTALEACDASDGIRDNVIGLPRECQLSLDAVKACSNDTAAADCLTRAQRHAIEAVYAPATVGSSSGTRAHATTRGCTCCTGSCTAQADRDPTEWIGSALWSIGSSTGRRRNG
jgi:Tannase and feruloyl esterase